MKVLQIYRLLELKIPNYSKLILKGLHSDTVEEALNTAAFDVFSKFFEVFEQNQYTKFGISNLIIHNKLMDVVENTELHPYQYGKIYNTNDVYFSMSEFIDIAGKVVNIIPIKHDYYLTNINNNMRKPDINYHFWRLDIGTTDNNNVSREIILDKDYLNNDVRYYITYIKLPSKIDLSNINSFIDINDEILVKNVIPLAIKYILEKFVMEDAITEHRQQVQQPQQPQQQIQPQQQQQQ